MSVYEGDIYLAKGGKACELKGEQLKAEVAKIKNVRLRKTPR